MPATADTSPPPSIAAAWVRNNALAALISGATSLAIYAVRHATGVPDGDAGFAAIVFLYAVAIVLSGFAGAAYGVLSGAVLQRIVPLLPVHAWIALNAAMAVVAGVLSEIGLMLLRGAPPADDASLAEILVVGLVVGGILGAAIGGLQALVLRKVALGVSAWVGWSAVAFIAAVLLIAGAGKLWETGGGFAGELANQAIAFVAYVIVSLLMLPALRRLLDPMLSRAGPHFD